MSDNDFTHFYATAFQPVSRAVRAFCGDADVAHDATQEAFARAYARWPRVRAALSPQAWVTTTALNLTRRRFRRRRQIATATAAAPGPSGDRLDVLAALRALPERQRRAAVLHYVADFSVAMVAEVMGLSEGTVKAHLHKARSTMRQRLDIDHA